MKIRLPYGKDHIIAHLPDEWETDVIQPKPWVTAADEREIVNQALQRPYGGQSLRELAKGKRTVCIVTSDHTRPVPSQITLPLLLKELRAGNPEIQVKILIATGCHRGCTTEELLQKFGEDLISREIFLMHDSDSDESVRFVGLLPSGGRLYLNKEALDAELLIAEGFIEPHFFAGFSGGRKSVLPGIAARKTVMYNHNAAFIQHENARAGCLAGNPIQADMAAAAKMAGLSFILNVILDEKKRVTAAFAGEPEHAHAAGCSCLAAHAGIRPSKAPVVLTTNGGYPLDQNLYQCVKGLATAEQFCEQDGVIILAAACEDGLGGESFYRTMAAAASPSALMNEILSVPAEETRIDQWQYQILARILQRRKVIVVTNDALQDKIEQMHMHFAASIEEALQKAADRIGQYRKVIIIPDGVGVYTKK